MSGTSIYSDGALPPELEFHGKDLWTDKGDWKHSALGERFRFALFEVAVEKVLAEDITILFQAIDQRKLSLRYSLPEPPHKLAMKLILKRVDRYLEVLGTKGLVISDQLGSPTEHDRYRQHFFDYKKFGTGGDDSSFLNNLLDTIHFVPSKFSRLIQAIDMLTYINRRRRVSRAATANESKMLNIIWSRTEEKMIENRTW